MRCWPSTWFGVLSLMLIEQFIFFRCFALSTPPTTSKTSSLRQLNQSNKHLPKQPKLSNPIDKDFLGSRHCEPYLPPSPNDALHQVTLRNWQWFKQSWCSWKMPQCVGQPAKDGVCQDGRYLAHICTADSLDWGAPFTMLFNWLKYIWYIARSSLDLGSRYDRRCCCTRQWTWWGRRRRGREGMRRAREERSTTTTAKKN